MITVSLYEKDTNLVKKSATGQADNIKTQDTNICISFINDFKYEVGESRETMSIHYSSDEEAARILTHKMLQSMWKNPVFLSDLRNDKAE